ncbi:hypothetical protein FRB93_001545 [Tulasnella sp. JGI-2019a]|nr:hypothetical protein FRB93_001545 [Tulasnella sp. JGI-2019a]
MAVRIYRSSIDSLLKHSKPNSLRRTPREFRPFLKLRKKQPRLSRKLASVGLIQDSLDSMVADSYSTSVIPDRIQKLKDARAQAEKEIEKYRIAKDQEFKKYEAEVRSTALFELILLY